MNRKTKYTVAILTLLLIIIISACAGSTVDVPSTTEFNADSETAIDGKTLLNERCTACHTLDRVERTSKSPAEWGANVRSMVSKGAELSASEQQVLIDYLAITYP